MNKKISRWWVSFIVKDHPARHPTRYGKPRDNWLVARSVACLVIVLAALVLTAPASAAYPRYVIVSGPRLPQPILLSQWSETITLMEETSWAPRAGSKARRSLRTRIRYDLALFWEWSPEEAPPTRPRDAQQHGWFYPATARRRAIVDLRVNGIRIPRFAPEAVLRIFVRHHIPTRV